MSAPLAEAVLHYAGLGVLPLHTPGHKGGRGAHPMLQRFFTEEGLRADVSLSAELDDLHAPTGCIRAAETLAAEAYGADAAYFMVNGTTGAIHTMLMATLAPGDALLVPRNVHRSVVGAMILTGVRPVYMQPEIDTRLGIAMGVSLAAVKRAVREHPEARAALLVYPTYYGVATELAAIADFLHEQGKLLLVDAAHGSHFAFSDELPPSAMAAGADLSAESTHKLLGSLTQTSMLLARGGRVPTERIRTASGIVQSTSPNEILLASLDLARAQMAESGAERLAAAISCAHDLRRRINKIEGLWAFGAEHMGAPGVMALDPMKITVQVTGLGLTGFAAEEELRRRGIAVELADARNVLLLLSYADGERETEQLLAALRDMAATCAPLCTSRGAAAFLSLPPIPRMEMEPRAAYFAPHACVRMEAAEGRIAAETIVFYPPGIPVLAAGDVIDGATLSYLSAMKAVGARVVGAADASLGTLLVIAEGSYGKG
ncbi:aminotransferase class I/II-fold pyridoxal phosphate-dependent enzyme [Selenomonas sp. oral taxon 138]|uniref:aminotransferase class I/II-fold pyridoxal phosphate-dependent enzyme n=1 Tax=Selenomonas sp. oral taxon 138 TaxID=712532 RepID=UPI0002A42B75|nr:aminotransferase class I/II-fold pyridoxal phosphate-dependent enzyme [Selenomonas sp. oral taxon 138]EKX99362.1 putative arginine 2-monooxygenase [Selenomonas sp. oral taxon 138 str. F0429]